MAPSVMRKRLYLLVVRSNDEALPHLQRGLALVEPEGRKHLAARPPDRERSSVGTRRGDCACISRSARLNHPSACSGEAASSSRHDARGTRTGSRQGSIVSVRWSPAAANAANFDLPIGLYHMDRAMEAWYHFYCMNDPQPEGHMASYIGRRKFLATLGGVAAWPLTYAAFMPYVNGFEP